MNRNARQLTAAVSLVAYSAIVFRVLVFKFSMFRIGHLRFRFVGGTREPNLSPFRTISSYLHGQPLSLIALLNVLGNVALFVPIGFLIPLVFRAVTWPGVLAVAVVLGLAIEGTQMGLRVGIFDIDDVILNALGVMIGYGTFALLGAATAQER
jgi:glycopeptide antibiotics resistance protein